MQRPNNFKYYAHQHERCASNKTTDAELVKVSLIACIRRHSCLSEGTELSISFTYRPFRDSQGCDEQGARSSVDSVGGEESRRVVALTRTRAIGGVRGGLKRILLPEKPTGERDGLRHPHPPIRQLKICLNHDSHLRSYKVGLGSGTDASKYHDRIP